MNKTNVDLLPRGESTMLDKTGNNKKQKTRRDARANGASLHNKAALKLPLAKGEDSSEAERVKVLNLVIE